MLAILILLPIRAATPLNSGTVNLGFLLAVAALPMMVSQARSKFLQGGIWATATIALALTPTVVAASLLMGRGFSIGAAVTTLVFISKGFVLLLSVLWTRTRFQPTVVAICFAAGLAVHYLTQLDAVAVNPWKYAFSTPITILALAIAGLFARRWPSYAAITILMVITALGDYRSFIAILALALLATIFGPLAVKSRVGLPRLLLGLAAIMFALYQAVVLLSLGGFLGARNQRVTADQLAQGGSLLSAGRPEWHASIALFLKGPIGFGPGVTPTTDDVNLGIAALSDAGVDTSTAQVRTYMFGGNLQLHSIAADLWVALGIGGLVLAVALSVVVLKGAYREVREPKPWLALTMFLSILALWDIAFSPIETNLIEVCFAVGMLLPSQSLDTRVPSLEAHWPAWMIWVVHSGRSVFHRGQARIRARSASEVAQPKKDERHLASQGSPPGRRAAESLE